MNNSHHYSSSENAILYKKRYMKIHDITSNFE